MFSLQDCKNWLGEQVISSNGNADLSAIAIDSRKIKPQQLFIAFDGKNCKGADFIESAIKNGAAAVISAEPIIADIANIQVFDVAKAMQTIAVEIRKKFTGKLIAITGSAGKTSTKNACFNMLQHSGNNLIATEGNYNNELGVPMTLSRINNINNYAVVELGTGKPNDMQFIANMAKPDICIITNISYAHIGHFASLQAIAEEKSAIIYNTNTQGTVIVGADDDFYNLWIKKAENRKILTVGFSNNADIKINNNTKYKNDIELIYLGKSYRTKSNLIGVGNLYAVAFAFAVAVACQQNLQKTINLVKNILPETGRMQYYSLAGIEIINDSYNANPLSVKAAINFIADNNQNKHTIILLGDMADLGDKSEQLHQEIGLFIKDKLFNNCCIWAVGKLALLVAENSGLAYKSFIDVVDLIDNFKSKNINLIDGDRILVKGSNSVNLSNFIELLDNNYGNKG